MRSSADGKKVLVIGISLLMLCSPVFSKEPESKVLLESRYIVESDIEQQAGQLAIAESKFSFEHEFKLENGMPISISFRNRHTDIDGDVPAVYLPSTLEARSLGLGVKFPAPFTQSENYFIGLDVSPSMNTDGWNRSASSAFRIPGRAYLIYRRDENLMLIAALSIRPDFDTQIFPIIGFIYKPNDRLAFNFASDNPNVTYRVSDKTKLFAELDMVNDEYELTRSPNKGRVLIYRQYSSGFGIEHQFAPAVTGMLSTGYVFSRSIKYEDGIGKIEPEAAMYVKAKIQIRF